MKITIEINRCGQCRHVDHSGAFTPGGARTICRLVGKDNAPAGDPEPYHWKHRIIEDPKKIPDWCPLKRGKRY